MTRLINLLDRKIVLCRGNPLPVMMFYFGGGFDIGTAEMYPGDALATAGDVIVVNTNYRVSMMGFFSTGELSDMMGS